MRAVERLIMCGIFGRVRDVAAAAGGDDLDPSIEAMAAVLRHRGPDHEGVASLGPATLGNTRLAIVDLAASAVQPFASPDNAVLVVCNGEIYNAPTLRRRYAAAGYPFKSDHSDVEPIVPLYLERGEQFLDELDGMFALAIYDLRHKKLILARDRAGEKPLFYTAAGGDLRFASEIQALLAAGCASDTLRREAVLDYLTFGYPVAPATMFEDIEKVEAGTMVIADRDGLRTRRYWDACAARESGAVADPEAVLERLGAAVARQTMSDVPVGIFLSGGIDSSLLATEVVRSIPAADIHTYVARFDRRGFDESDDAADLARSLGTRHHVVDAGDASLLAALDRAVGSIAEPMGDPAVLPTIVLAEAASSNVKVVMSGEGADELFGGYPTYLGHLWASRFARLPRPLRDLARALARAAPAGSAAVSIPMLLRRFTEESDSPIESRHLAWFGACAGLMAESGHASAAAARAWERTGELDDGIQRVMRFDLVTYLAENLFTKIDRATMLAGIEARAPFVDRELMECALAQPSRSAVAGLATKKLLRRAAALRLPSKIVTRRKRGLSVPVSSWLNDALRDEADELLAGAALEAAGIPAHERIAALLAEHRRGDADHGRRLWPLLSLQLWRRRWTGVESSRACAAMVRKRPALAQAERASGSRDAR